LLQKIRAGDWSPGAIISTEKELAEQYDLSRATVRQAIQQLVHDGHLIRRRGLGTFVAQRKLRHGPQRDFGITGYLRAHGLRPGWVLLHKERVITPPRAAVALALADNEPSLEIVRLRLADDEAIGIHTVYLPYPIADGVVDEFLTAGESSQYYLQECLHVTLSESHRYIEAVPAEETEAELLGVSSDTPLLVVHRTTIAADGSPVEYLRAAYRGDRFEYYVHLEH
jgi:GntR family transcriptional regulator